MGQQHAQGNLPLLVLKATIWLQYPQVLQLRTQTLDLLPVVEAENALLDELHARDPRQHLRAGRYPEDRV